LAGSDIEGSTMPVTSDEIMAKVEGQTIPTAFLATVEAHGDRTALRWRNDDDSWGEWTFREYADRVARAAAAYRELGVEPGQKVVLMLRNTPEFHILDVAAYFCGATPVSIYNSSSPEQVEYLVNHSEAVFGIAEDVGFLERFLKVRSELETLSKLAVVKDPDGLAPDDVLSYDTLLDREGLDLRDAAAHCDPDQLATMIYTSGTTGPPKGVMLSHRNIMWTVESLLQCIGWERADLVGKRMVSYLPMAHIAERMTSHYQGIVGGYEVTTCPDPSSIAEYLRHAKPNIFFGVPRVFEKVYAGVNAALAADPEKAQQFNEAVEAAMPIVEARTWGRATEEQLQTYEFLDQVAFSTVRGLIGMDDCELAITGAAPLPAEILSWFRAIGVPMTEVYGMSESSGPMTLNAWQPKPGSVGTAIPGCEVKLADDGEVICRGGNVFLGYYKEPEKTADALDEDGWLHSGDIGEVDDDGYFRIVDRKKELIITAGGKNISPANLEAALKMIPLVGQAAAIGDGRPFVAALVVLDPEVAPVWAGGQGIEFDTLADLATHPTVEEEVNRGLREVMQQFNNAERVKKVVILGEEWLPDSEVLTPTSKLKRRGIHARYAMEIEALYG
jgi:long-chain acyl-CoA synthetase